MTPEQKRERDEEWFFRARGAIFAPGVVVRELNADKLMWPLPVFDRMPDIMGGHHAMKVIRQQYLYGSRNPMVRWSPPPPPIDFAVVVRQPSDMTGTMCFVDFRIERVNRPRGRLYPEESFVVEFASERDQEVFIKEMKRLIDIKRRHKLGIG